MRVSLVPNVTAGGELHPALTGLQRTSVCFQGRGKARPAESCGSEGFVPRPSGAPENTDGLRLVIEVPVTFGRQLRHRAQLITFCCFKFPLQLRSLSLCLTSCLGLLCRVFGIATKMSCWSGAMRSHLLPLTSACASLGEAGRRGVSQEPLVRVRAGGERSCSKRRLENRSVGCARCVLSSPRLLGSLGLACCFSRTIGTLALLGALASRRIAGVAGRCFMSP